MNAEGEVVLNLSDGSFDPSITDNTGASAATIAYLCTAEKGSTLSSTGLGAKILNEEAPNNAKDSSSKDGGETGSADNKDPFEGSSKAPSSEDKSNDK